MKKAEYINLLITDNETSGDKKGIYNDVIDCVDIALSQTPKEFEIDGSIGLETLYAEIEKKGREKMKSGVSSVGPFEAAELIAAKLGTKYERITRKAAAKGGMIELEDFF